ncbi:hypothetical protein PAPYR_11206 [Paratrimastix pyriformis]|uniref:Cysteine dioxygenase n=1 Tax=Paratrimastix pyriformis TaxID=342808 RepID=A0ABQ8U6X7_9EUKA|nr:hypothetical protein PAPYR_11206 [Paratrimastix pyriformis]
MRCDLLIAQKDESTAGTDMTCQILFDKFLDVSAVLRACCASVHSFLVWGFAGDNIARTRVMLTSDPSRKAPMTHWLLNSSPDAQTQDRELPELTRWLFCGQGVHAERGECPTSAVRTGVALRGASRGLVTACSFAKPYGVRNNNKLRDVRDARILVHPRVPRSGIERSQQAGGQVRNNFGISALLGLEIGDNSLTASKPLSCTSFLNGFSSDPVCAVPPAPGCLMFFLWGGPALAHDHHPNTGTLCYVLEGLARVHALVCSWGVFYARAPFCPGVFVDSEHRGRIAYTPNGVYIDRVKGGATRWVFTLISQCDTVTLWGP